METNPKKTPRKYTKRNSKKMKEKNEDETPKMHEEKEEVVASGSILDPYKIASFIKVPHPINFDTFDAIASRHLNEGEEVSYFQDEKRRMMRKDINEEIIKINTFKNALVDSCNRLINLAEIFLNEEHLI